ncbi:MAG: enoyl-CoA hydratase/isomerase family protein [Bacteroidetes bacterium]|jgi:enoyl-CoA hydratase|nr:enoyl-CoA hydratase/isomerase family protein [Bacteroidota bacterium]HMT36110.1 enoyl-CoA hydratase-related protein [Chitinophagaceae bacterium]MBK6821065.1 enoyl-CoA hydratase/isomerase family protein [Bacteroidota bacterium]MBK7039334.1 enoyl-CoA hydratase/isomerase family protein [Bacteroidota bacterium]MBK7588225.1 enoyl-CoA hydratase/isomerase family protein [Bacteroidota bacterium]
MEFNTLLFAIENGIATITINRPDKLNALNKDVIDDLSQALDEVYTNREIQSAIITGAGPKAFVAGADISEFITLGVGEGADLARKGQTLVFDKIENSPKPIIAAVNGFALGGGCELAMSCHFRLAAENAKFGQPEVNLGLIPGYGGTQRLTALTGKGKAMELCMTSAIIDAQEALRIGLVNHVFPAETLMAKTIEMLTLINTKAPLALTKVIQCVNVAGQASGFETEINLFGECFATADMKEGVSAFLEKRKASFEGA